MGLKMSSTGSISFETLSDQLCIFDFRKRSVVALQGALPSPLFGSHMFKGKFTAGCNGHGNLSTRLAAWHFLTVGSLFVLAFGYIGRESQSPVYVLDPKTTAVTVLGIQSSTSMKLKQGARPNWQIFTSNSRYVNSSKCHSIGPPFLLTRPLDAVPDVSLFVSSHLQHHSLLRNSSKSLERLFGTRFLSIGMAPPWLCTDMHVFFTVAPYDFLSYDSDPWCPRTERCPIVAHTEAASAASAATATSFPTKCQMSETFGQALLLQVCSSRCLLLGLQQAAPVPPPCWSICSIACLQHPNETFAAI